MFILYRNFDLNQPVKFFSVDGLRLFLQHEEKADGLTHFIWDDVSGVYDYSTIAYNGDDDSWQIDYGIADRFGSYIETTDDADNFEFLTEASAVFVQLVIENEDLKF